MNQDLRWVQRYSNFDKAFQRLKESLELEQLSELERNGVVQRFEFTLELAWKTMKDFLENEGFQFKPTPKETIRQAFQAGFITDAQPLIDGFEIRNELSHDYSGHKFRRAESELRESVYPALIALHEFFNRQSSLFEVGVQYSRNI
ncbi:MAG: HI0074 family nucleotidyltransferase substrate-binding subunit [Bacteroidota bacterium]